jgi:ferredoxin-NADP reductase
MSVRPAGPSFWNREISRRLPSAGIGATPVLAMLYALAANRSKRQIFWLHSARDRQHHPFASEARSMIGKLQNARACLLRQTRRGRQNGRAFRLCRSPVSLRL